MSNALGIALERKYVNSNQDFEIEIRLPKLPKPSGLSVHIGDDFLIWRTELNLDYFSRSLLEKMNYYYLERKELFLSFYDSALTRNKSLNLLINNTKFTRTEVPSAWNDFNLIISNAYSSKDDEFKTLYQTLLDFFCLILILLVEQTEWEPENATELNANDFEGEKSLIQSNKYERSRYNRALCLAFYGFSCRGCGIHMKEIYGPLGDGVIHVHHIVPVSQMGGSYRIDPIKDLIPLCPNCHNIVHKVNPPLPIEELKKLTNF